MSKGQFSLMRRAWAAIFFILKILWIIIFTYNTLEKENRGVHAENLALSQL